MQLKKLVFICACTCAIALCQARLPKPPEIPNHEVYNLFFLQVLALEQVADQMDANKENGSAVRHYFQEQIGLNPKEAEALKALAQESVDALKVEEEQSRARMELLLPARHDSVPRQSAQAATIREEVKNAVVNRQEVIDYRLTLLRAKLGQPSFEKLDSYVQTQFAPRIQTNPLSMPGQSLETPATPGGAQ